MAFTCPPKSRFSGPAGPRGFGAGPQSASPGSLPGADVLRGELFGRVHQQPGREHAGATDGGVDGRGIARDVECHRQRKWPLRKALVTRAGASMRAFSAR